MKKRLDAGFQERHHVRSLLFAGRKYAPKPFLSAIAPVASCALRHLANCLFAEIVRRRNIFVDETKILLLPIPQSFRNIDRVVVVRDRKSPSNLCGTTRSAALGTRSLKNFFPPCRGGTKRPGQKFLLYKKTHNLHWSHISRLRSTL